MTDRIEAAVAELVAALRAELRTGPRPALDAPPALLSIREAARRAGIGRSAMYAAIGRGEVRSLLIGRRRLIAADAIDELATRGSA